MKKAHPVFDIEANCSVFDEAIPTLIDMDLIGKVTEEREGQRSLNSIN
nr:MULTISPECIES: hypothetical protein [unclassified Colwellia]